VASFRKNRGYLLVAVKLANSPGNRRQRYCSASWATRPVGCGRTRTCALRRNRRTSPPANSLCISSPGNGRRGTGISACRGPKSHGPEVTAICHHRRVLYTSDNGTLGVLPFRPRGHKFPRQDSNLHLPRSRRSNRSLHHRPR